MFRMQSAHARLQDKVDFDVVSARLTDERNVDHEQRDTRDHSRDGHPERANEHTRRQRYGLGHLYADQRQVYQVNSPKVHCDVSLARPSSGTKIANTRIAVAPIKVATIGVPV